MFIPLNPNLSKNGIQKTTREIKKSVLFNPVEVPGLSRHRDQSRSPYGEQELSVFAHRAFIWHSLRKTTLETRSPICALLSPVSHPTHISKYPFSRILEKTMHHVISNINITSKSRFCSISMRVTNLDQSTHFDTAVFDYSSNWHIPIHIAQKSTHYQPFMAPRIKTIHHKTQLLSPFPRI